MDAPRSLPALTRGLDVLSPETSLPSGSARVVSNVTLADDGSFARRPGHSALFALAGAHSLWRSPTTGRTLVASGNGLYQVNLAAASATLIFTGLTPEAPVEYDEVADTTYFCTPAVLGKITAAGLVRRPGVATLLGYKPTLAATIGGLTAGIYGVAYSLLNDLGEESGISAIAYIDLPSGGGITLTNLQTASSVTQMNVYVTTPNGTELHRYETLTVAGTATITDQKQGRGATRQFLDPMPGGSFVRLFRGRLYVASGAWLYISDKLDYGVMNARSGWLTFGRTITMIEPVESGIFIGLSDRTIFLRGTGPEDFQQTTISARGARPHTGARVPADYFDAGLVRNREYPVASWATECGFAIGRHDGSVAYPQADRLRLAGDTAGRTLFMRRNGVRQAVVCVESIDYVGPAVDGTI